MHIDSHQHFWIYNETDYVWMTDDMSALRQDFLPEALLPQLQFLGFGGTIAVQARQKLLETQWLLDLADNHPFIQGVVGWFDFQTEQLDEQLERFASHKKLKGVRELIHDKPDINYATSGLHMSAISKLAKFNLTYDLLLKPIHIRPAIELVRAFPDQPFVVDHLAKPSITSTGESPWAGKTKWECDLRELAKCQNVYCKLSGMVTEAAWNSWKLDDFLPVLNTALDAFGPNRLMIGSDWPVCTLSGTYENVMGIVVDFADSLAEDERSAILGGNCARFYGISFEEKRIDCRDSAGAQL